MSQYHRLSSPGKDYFTGPTFRLTWIKFSADQIAELGTPVAAGELRPAEMYYIFMCSIGLVGASDAVPSKTAVMPLTVTVIL